MTTDESTKTVTVTVTVSPTKDALGVWRFDDEALGLVAEPFVGTANTLIDVLLNDASAYACELTASILPPDQPGMYAELMWLRVDIEEGNWYRADFGRTLALDVWLCPVLDRYFGVPPARLFMTARAKGATT